MLKRKRPLVTRRNGGNQAPLKENRFATKVPANKAPKNNPRLARTRMPYARDMASDFEMNWSFVTTILNRRAKLSVSSGKERLQTTLVVVI
jgi:hypothetical protein